MPALSSLAVVAKMGPFDEWAEQMIGECCANLVDALFHGLYQLAAIQFGRLSSPSILNRQAATLSNTANAADNERRMLRGQVFASGCNVAGRQPQPESASQAATVSD
jgi:hypothetical protein